MAFTAVAASKDRSVGGWVSTRRGGRRTPGAIEMVTPYAISVSSNNDKLTD